MTQSRKFSELDDYLIHQTPNTMDEMGYGGRERDWFEHNWVTLWPHGPNGPCVQAVWQVIPHVNMMYGMCMVADGDTQYTLQLGRELQNDRAKTVVGPLAHSVVRPLRRYSIRLEENPHIPVTFDVDMESWGPIEVFPLEEYEDRELSIKCQWSTKIGLVKCKGGAIKIGDKTYYMDHFRGTHDQCWGIRSGRMATALHIWLVGWFEDTAFQIAYRDEKGGEKYRSGYIVADGRRVDVVDVQVDWQFEHGTREMLRGEWTVLDSTGKTRKIRARKYTRALLDFAWIGEGSGRVVAPYYAKGEVWDLTDKALLTAQGGRTTREGYVELEMDGKIGYGGLEYALSKAHPTYGPQIR